MNINTVGGEDTKLYDALMFTLKMFSDSVFDPYLSWKWSKREQVRKTIEDIRYLRSLARNLINERLERIKNEKLSTGTDIFSNILNSWGLFFFLLF